MTRFLAALLLLAAPAFADDDLVDGLLAQLAAERSGDREVAKSRLLVLGAPAIARALEAYPNASPVVRAEIADVVGRGGGEAEIRRILVALDDKDEYVARTAAGYLLDGLSPDRLDPLLEAALAETAVKTARGRELAEGILRTHLYERVEIQIRSRVAPGGSNLFYEGQFASLRELGDEVGNVVLTMFLEGKRYRYLHPVADGEERTKLAFLVGEALIDVATEDMRGILREAYRETADEDARQQQILAALVQAGDMSLVQDRIRGLEMDILRAADPDPKRHELAQLYYRIRMHEKSLAIYRQILARRPNDTLALYNMACALTRLGRIDEAFAALEKAVSYGYDVAKSGEKDGDLAPLLKDPRWARFKR